VDGAVFYAVRSVQLTSATTDYGTPLDDEKTVLGWIAEYYNGDGVFLEERLHLLAVTFSESDFGWVAFHDEADGLYPNVLGVLVRLRASLNTPCPEEDGLRE